MTPGCALCWGERAALGSGFGSGESGTGLAASLPCRGRHVLAEGPCPQVTWPRSTEACSQCSFHGAARTTTDLKALVSVVPPMAADPQSPDCSTPCSPHSHLPVQLSITKTYIIRFYYFFFPALDTYHDVSVLFLCPFLQKLARTFHFIPSCI